MAATVLATWIQLSVKHSNLSSSWSGWNPSRIADESWLSQTITEASVYTVVTPMLATITGYIVLERFGTSHHEQYNGLRHCQEGSQADIVQIVMLKTPLTARLIWPTWGPSGADRTQVGPCCLHEILLSGLISIHIYSPVWNIVHFKIYNDHKQC